MIVEMTPAATEAVTVLNSVRSGDDAAALPFHERKRVRERLNDL
jgi:hypothetical protein